MVVGYWLLVDGYLLMLLVRFRSKDQQPI